MPSVKNLNTAAEKYARRAAAAAQDYSAGVQATTVDWAGATAAASEVYNQAIQESMAKGSYAKGVQAAGTQKWKAKTAAKGPARYAEGTRQAAPDWQKGFAPIAAAIESVQIPPRGVRNSPGNYARQQAVANAAHEARNRQKS